MGDGTLLLSHPSQFQEQANGHAGWDRNGRKIDEEPLWRRFSISKFGGDQPDDGGCFFAFDARSEGADKDRIWAETHLCGRPGLVLPDRGAVGGDEFERRFLVRVLHARSVEYAGVDGIWGGKPR